MKLYNLPSRNHCFAGFFLVELAISCCIFVVIATIISQCQSSFYTLYKNAYTRIQTVTTLQSITEEYLYQGSSHRIYDIPIVIKETPVLVKFLPGKPITINTISLTATTKNGSYIHSYCITTGICKKNESSYEKISS